MGDGFLKCDVEYKHLCHIFLRMTASVTTLEMYAADSSKAVLGTEHLRGF